MSKVYVSSTFRDLRRCRQSVLEALRLLGHQDIAMEHYGAEPRPPVEKCLRDVESCDIYVGIFGRRYGWVPPSSTQSITEQEYRQAVRSEKEVIIFLLDEDVRLWKESKSETSKQQALLKKLRAEISERFLPARFSSCEDLAIKVIAALANLGGTPMTPPDVAREAKLLNLIRDRDLAIRSRAKRALVEMGSAAYAAVLRAGLIKGDRATPEQRSADVHELSEIEDRNHRVMPLLRDLLKAADPSTRAAVVFEFAQRALQRRQPSDEDVRSILELSSHESADVRREVAHAMWKFLPRPEEVKLAMQEHLGRLVSDRNEAVRNTAMYSLSKVRSWM